MSYVAPIKDMLFDIRELADLESIAEMPGFEEAGLDTAQAVLDECANFTQEVLAPLNVEGDRHPSTWHDGQVTTTPGFKEAFDSSRKAAGRACSTPWSSGGRTCRRRSGQPASRW